MLFQQDATTVHVNTAGPTVLLLATRNGFMVAWGDAVEPFEVGGEIGCVGICQQVGGFLDVPAATQDFDRQSHAYALKAPSGGIAHFTAEEAL